MLLKFASVHSARIPPSQIRTADGREFEVVVPNGVKEGDIFHIEIPDAPTATATAVPVAQGVPVCACAAMKRISDHQPSPLPHRPRALSPRFHLCVRR